MTHTDTMDALVEFDIKGTQFSLFDPGDTVAKETFCSLGYEPAVVDLLDQLEQRYPTATFYDIGALHGYYSALIAKRYEGWSPLAFEPNPVAFSVLERNVASAGAAGAARQQALNDTGASLHFKGRTIVDPSTQDAIVVPGMRFDDLPESPAPAKIVKIDVHGAEGLVLAGMENSLVADVSAVLIEVHAQHLLVGPQSYDQILKMLETKGFEVFEVDNFRGSDTATLVPMIDARRDQFVDYAQWTKDQIGFERLIFAQRPEGTGK